MKKLFLLIATALFASSSFAQADSAAKVPFGGMDMRWMNGADRRDSSVLTSKYVQGYIMIDGAYTHSFNNPIDNTVVGSSAFARNNEMQLNCANFGADFTYLNARGKIMTQFGTRTTLVPRNDWSAYRGQHNLADVYKYISEIYAGYHFDVLYGLNVDAGLFMSYVGLNSAYQCENWEYQPSFTSDNTPWFFNGVRAQLFVSRTVKTELWLINGWQSYGMFNKAPGVGGNFTWAPRESFKLVTNNYVGHDAALCPNRLRFHSDNSISLRYYNKPSSRGISKAAISLTSDFGFENGDGVKPFNGDSLTPSQNFITGMFYHRLWFNKDKFAWTFGGGFMSNPGRYLVLAPAGDASSLPSPSDPTKTIGTHPFSQSPGDKFNAFDCSTNFDWMPNQSITFRVEFVHRQASVPYFAGRGGVTSPNGYVTTPVPSNWKPDLVKAENRFLLAVLFRI